VLYPQNSDRILPIDSVTSPPITHSRFHCRLKTFVFCKSFPLQPFLFLFQDSLHGFPGLFSVISDHICSLLLVFLFLHFLVVGSVRQITLTHVGFRAHVKIASRIVLYPTIQRHILGGVDGRRVVGPTGLGDAAIVVAVILVA